MSAGETTARRDLPSGTVTFLFTDVVGSTRLWEEHAAEMHDARSRDTTRSCVTRSSREAGTW